MKSVKVIGWSLLIVLLLALIGAWFFVLWVVASWLVDDLAKVDGLVGFCLKLVAFSILAGVTTRVGASARDKE